MVGTQQDIVSFIYFVSDSAGLTIGDVVKHTLVGMQREFEVLHDYIQTA